MAKSKGNFYTLPDVLARRNDPAAVRYLFLSVPYRKKLNFTWEGLAGAAAAVDRLRVGASRASTKSPRSGKSVAGGFPSAERAAKLREEFTAAIDDDLNTSGRPGRALHVPARGQRGDRRGDARRRGRAARRRPRFAWADRVFGVLPHGRRRALRGGRSADRGPQRRPQAPRLRRGRPDPPGARRPRHRSRRRPVRDEVEAGVSLRCPGRGGLQRHSPSARAAPFSPARAVRPGPVKSIDRPRRSTDDSTRMNGRRGALVGGGGRQPGRAASALPNSFGRGEPKASRMEPPARTGSGVFVLSERLLPIPAYVASLAPRDAGRCAAARGARAPAGDRDRDASRPTRHGAIPVRDLLALDPRPLIVTYRTRAEGGRLRGLAGGVPAARAAAYAAGATVDVEHASGLLSRLRPSCPTAGGSSSRIIRSSRSRADVERAARRRCARPAPGRSSSSAAWRIFRRACEVAAIQARHAGDSVADLPDGPGEPPGPRALGALRARRSSTGPSRRRRRRASCRSPISSRSTTSTGRGRSTPSSASWGPTSRARSRRALHNALFRSRGLPFLYLPLPAGRLGARTRRRELAFDPPFRGFSVTQPVEARAAASAPAIRRRARHRRGQHARRDRPDRWRAENTDVDGDLRSSVGPRHGGGADGGRSSARAARRGRRSSRRGSSDTRCSSPAAATRRPTRSPDELHVDSLARRRPAGRARRTST